MSNNSHSNGIAVQFLFENSLFLIFGAIAALVWANLDKESHTHFFETPLKVMVGIEDEEDVHDEHESPEHSDDEHGDPARSDAEQGDAEDDATSSAPEESGGEGMETAAVAAESHDASVDSDAEHSDHGEHSHPINLYFFINDILMAFFFAIAAKEVWESLLPGGALSNPRKAATPLLATLGGIIGPAAVYVGVIWFSAGGGTLSALDAAELYNGWAVPCATDIAFSYLIARLIFGQGHPAIAFLLLLAIADDAAGLMILAVFYPQGEMHPVWLLLTVAAVAIGFIFQKVFKIRSFWPYLLIPGTMSWFSFYFTGIHAALGLVPIVITMPHAHTDLGIFAIQELKRHDTLNEFEHWWKNPVEIFLGLFGLCNAGVEFSNVGLATWAVLAGLLIGKPVGITLFTFISEKVFRLEMPHGMGYSHIIVLGCMAGIGFTVALFVSTAAFAGSEFLDSAKMGALASFGAALIAFVAAKIFRIKKHVMKT